MTDEEAAEVVRRIYRMTIEGKGPYQIARELSEEKIERPSYYLGKKGLGNHASNYDKENPYMWRGNQVTTLIARPEYIGKTVNFRTFKNSYKDKKTKRADKEDWVVFDDTQEPIVDEETWLLAQKLRQNVRKADPMGEPNVLTVVRQCIITGNEKGEKEYIILLKEKKGQVIPIRQIVMNVPHIILGVRNMTGIVLATIFQQKHLKASF